MWTGYSSLSRLDQCPLDIVKVDKSFVAEGIETENQLNRLQALGCTLGQGYLLSRPEDPAAIEWLLIDQQLVQGPDITGAAR